MTPFFRRQSVLIGLVILALVVATAASDLLRGILLPIVWQRPFYINPLYLFMFVLFGGVGLFSVMRSEDRGWPFFAAVVGAWIFVVAFEDSILQWFIFQYQAATIGGRADPILMAAAVAAMGGAILLHVNQLGRRLRLGFAERGIDPNEVQQVEVHAREVGVALVVRMGALAAAGGVALWIGEFALARARVGIGELGILGALLILSVLAVMAYRLLRTGAGVRPVDEERPDAPSGPAQSGRRPPRGLR